MVEQGEGQPSLNINRKKETTMTPMIEKIQNTKYYQTAPAEVQLLVDSYSEQNMSLKITGATMVQIAMGIENPSEEVVKYIATQKPKFFKDGNVPEAIKVAQKANMKVKAYVRLSSTASLDDNGFDRQKAMIEAQYPNAEWFEDVISGAVRSRPALDNLLAGLEAGDVVIIPSIDRLSRSTVDLLEIVETIQTKGATLKSITDTWLDTTGSNIMSEFLLTVMGALSQMERKMIAQRTKKGVELAKAKGVKFGRPLNNAGQVQHAIELYKSGSMSTREIEKATGVSRSTLMRRVRELKAKGEL